jgi:L-ascorbate metabolism protein UlaG (beta-lactamase superfamily)
MKMRMLPLVALTSTLAQEASPSIRKEDSLQWQNGQFVNTEPIHNHYWQMITSGWNASPNTTPRGQLPLIQVNPEIFHTAPVSGLRVTWLGHSTSLLEIDGQRILLDPVWAERASPFSWIGPKRWYPPLISLEKLPELDAVLISHDHWDHLDETAIRILAKRNPRFIVPLGVGKLLEKWGIAPSRITELDWWGTTMLGDMKIVATPARHASGRGLMDRFNSLWCGFALLSNQHRLYYSGDTGPQVASQEIGKRLGPFDLTLIECGQYNKAWPDWHMTPEQTFAMHQAVHGKVLMPVHWGLFRLSHHSWKDPLERLMAANTQDSVTVMIPKPGQSLEPSLHTKQERWWVTIE